MWNTARCDMRRPGSVLQHVITRRRRKRTADSCCGLIKTELLTWISLWQRLRLLGKSIYRFLELGGFQRGEEVMMSSVVEAACTERDYPLLPLPCNNACISAAATFINGESINPCQHLFAFLTLRKKEGEKNRGFLTDHLILWLLSFLSKYWDLGKMFI